MLEKKIAEKKAQIAVMGLGYVGLSVLEAFAEAGFFVLGYDCDSKKTDMLTSKQSYLNYLSLTSLFNYADKGRCRFSCDPNSLTGVDVFIITVPTSLDSHRSPDLSHVEDVAKTISRYLKNEQLVIMQSTSFPGTTEEVVLPILQSRGLKVGSDFYLSFIPEISDPGNPNFHFAQIPKIIGGVTEKSYEITRTLYAHICQDLYHCSSPKVAEAAKILQNAYRLVNISFINEMKIALDRMNIDVWDVIEAAAKKPFGFMPFYPGPGIGGDCIPVDPYYLVWKARETDGPTSLIERAGEINAAVHHYVIEKVKDALALDHKGIVGAKILILGIGFKKDVDDIRESPSLKVLTLMENAKAVVSYHDPYVSELSPSLRYPHMHMTSTSLDYVGLGIYDCVVILTDHSIYDWAAILHHSKRIVDTHNVVAKLPHALEKTIKA